jgi:ELWxxDGT repeat protein
MPRIIYQTWITNDPTIGFADYEIGLTDGTFDNGHVLKDINPGTSPFGGPGGPQVPDSSYPMFLTQFGNRVIFQANDGVNGTELWITDGTTNGTMMVKNINPGSGSAFPDWFGNPSFPVKLWFVELNGYMYFNANDGVHGNELWRTDGTPANTTIVANINNTGGVNGSNSSYPDSLVRIGNYIYFAADNGVNGRELWRTDGTTTTLVKNINTTGGANGPNSSNPYNLINFNGALVFVANDGVHDGELWRSDVTTGDTTLIKDIWVGAGQPNEPANLTVVGDALYFTMYTANHGSELWKTNGVPGDAGTVEVKDINTESNGNPGQNQGSGPHDLVNFNGTLFFAANGGIGTGDELWKSNGTSGGTTLVKDINLGGSGSFIQNMTVVGNTLYFTATDGTSNHGTELWKTNGTTTTMVADLSLGNNSSAPAALINVEGTLYFGAVVNTGGSNQWGMYKIAPDGAIVRVANNYGYGNGFNAFTFIPSSTNPGDFNADSRGDLLWRHSDGTTFAWLMRSGGTNYDGSNLGIISPQWHVEDRGDYNGDGIGDILWRHDDGTTFIWLMKNNATSFDGSNLGMIPSQWHIEGSGDFNGDHITDLLWRHNDGTTYVWLMNAAGKRATDINLSQIPTDWHIQGVADFDGDGDSDILWRNNGGETNIFRMQDGKHVGVDSLGVVPIQWHVQGTGDFDGDGDSDILWRHNDGTTYEWLMQSNQHVADRNLGLVPTQWQVQETADVDGDRDTDIIWRHNDGTTFAWLMQIAQHSSDVDLGKISTNWTLQHHAFDVV